MEIEKVLENLRKAIEEARRQNEKNHKEAIQIIEKFRQGSK